MTIPAARMSRAVALAGALLLLLPTLALGQAAGTSPGPSTVSHDWGQVPFESGLRDPHGASRITAVAAGPRGIVAVGTSPTGPAAWRSADGLAWERAIPPRSWTTTGPRGDFPSLEDVVATDEGFAIVGTERDGPRRDHGNIGSVWTSEDGLVWRRSARGVGPYLQHVIEHEGHLYAVGGSVANRDQGGIWASDDTTAWEQVHAAPVSVIASDGETIVAGTEDAMWWSADGRTWTAAPIEAGGADAWLEDATAFDDGFLAVGARDDDGAVWHSVDGRSWTAEPETLGTGAHITHLNAVAPLPTDGVLIAAGTNELTSLLYRYEVGEPWGEPILAVDGSDDGGEWPFTDAVVADGRTLIVGQGTDAPRRFSAAAWTTPPPGAFAAPGHAITACPGPRPTIDELVVMDAAARLACFGDQELTFRAWLAPHETADPEYFGRPQWLTAGAGGLRALPVAGSPSASMYLVLHMRPRDDARPGRSASRWAAVTGHFGDRASRT